MNGKGEKRERERKREEWTVLATCRRPRTLSAFPHHESLHSRAAKLDHFILFTRRLNTLLLVSPFPRLPSEPPTDVPLVDHHHHQQQQQRRNSDTSYPWPGETGSAAMRTHFLVTSTDSTLMHHGPRNSIVCAKLARLGCCRATGRP